MRSVNTLNYFGLIQKPASSGHYHRAALIGFIVHQTSFKTHATHHEVSPHKPHAYNENRTATRAGQRTQGFGKAANFSILLPPEHTCLNIAHAPQPKARATTQTTPLTHNNNPIPATPVQSPISPASPDLPSHTPSKDPSRGTPPRPWPPPPLLSPTHRLLLCLQAGPPV